MPPLDAPTPPRDRLRWVKLASQRVFWPACVYESYSAATRHTHDLSAIKEMKPALDGDERVVFFFGVRTVVHGAGIAAHATVVPSLRVCVVEEKEIAWHQWDGADDFGNVCRTHSVDAETIARVEQNSAFLRACGDATRLYEEANDDNDAAGLFMAFLTGPKTRGGNTQQHARPTPTATRPAVKRAIATSSVQKEISEKKVSWKTPVEKIENKDETSAKPTLTPELTSLCWSLMERAGWSTFVKPDGSKIYAMPGVQFFEFRPNETVFEALQDACIKFLHLWTQSDDADAHGDTPLHESLWSMMVAAGWQTIKSADQIMYVMPNTTFDRFIPNETIFQGKQAAIAKFLRHLGVQEQITSAKGDQSDMQDSDMASSSEAEDQNEEDDEEEDDLSQPLETAPSDIEMSDADSDHPEESDSASDEADEDDDDEDSVGLKRPVRRTLINNRKESNAKPPRRRKGKFQEMVGPVVPPFKLKQGLVEQELRSRGWFWRAVPMKKSADGFMFYKPHCEGKGDKELRVGHDCFAGYLSLEAYIKDFEPAIIDKLRADHEASYGRPNVYKEDPKKPRERARSVLQSRRIDVIELTDDDEESRVPDRSLRKSVSVGSGRRKPAHDQVKQYRAQPLSSQDIKFGDVWGKLAEKGWYYRPGAFEYDYFKPTGKKKQDMVRGEDYFSSKTALEEYLKTSGIWHDTAEEIKRGIDNDEPIHEEHPTPEKRKHSETEGAEVAHTPAPKKVKISDQERAEFLTPPPTYRAKKSAAPKLQEEDEATQDLDVLIESNKQISPESTSSKSRKEESTPESVHLARNLNNAFTPSPTAEKAIRAKESRQSNLSTPELARQSIARLSLGHQPAIFTHRESESDKILDFCRGCFKELRGGSLYLSGSPGCGKSALLRSLSEEIGQLHEKLTNAPDSIIPVHVNAMGLSDFNQLFRQVAETLTNKEFADGDEAFEAIERATKTGLKRSKTLFLVLDEIDALGKTSMETELCRLFELAHRDGHSFILVGIANQIDFTERHLASLRLQLPNIKPQVIVFKPYSFQTISDILMDRLGGATDACRIVNAHGVAFIARKVAAQSGDVRLALDICRRVLQQKLSDSTGGVENFGSPISLIDIVKTIKTVLEGKSKSNVSSLPRNLQMILFATTRLVAQANFVDSSLTPSPVDDSSTTHKLYRVDDLYECYCDVSHDAGVFKPLTRGEFKLGLETLSSEGMIGGAELKKQLLKLMCTPSELLQAFKNDAYFSRLI